MMFFKIKIALIAFILIAFPVLAQSSSVVVEELPTVYVNTLGLSKKLPFTSWGNLSVSEEKKLIDAVTLNQNSPVLRQMVRSVLIERTALQDKDENEEKYFLLRLSGLLQLGYFSDVLAMIEQVPPSSLTDQMEQLKVEAQLFQGNWRDVCPFVHSRSASTALFWQKANIMCLALEGEQDKALLSFSLWQEEHTEPMLFTTLMDAFLNGAPLSKLDLSEIRSIELSLMSRLGILIPKQKPEIKTIVPFQTAVNIEQLLKHWQVDGVPEQDQLYRLHVLLLYGQILRTDLNFLQTEAILNLPSLDGKVSFFSFSLRDKPQSAITGADLLRALFMLSERDVNLENAFLILNKGGLDVENWVLELIH